jgi:hypothetical protein
MTGRLGIHKILRFEEEMLCVGDTVSVLGLARRKAGTGTPRSDGYRSEPSTRLFLETSGNAGEEMLILKTTGRLPR